MPSGPLTARRTSVLWLILLGAAAGLLFDHALYSISFYATQRQDQTWLLYCAARVLDGVQLYGPRLVETNPPLIIWLSTVPAWLADHLHLQPLFVLHLSVTLLLTLTSLWIVRILRALGILSGLTPTLAVFVLLVFAQTWVRDVEFAEREHILTLLLLPYLVGSCFQLAGVLGRGERIALGFVAGIGACVKPQYVLILLGSELFLALWYRQLRRLWRPEVLTLCLTGIAYLAALACFTPLYFTDIVPVLKDTYPTYRGVHPMLWVMFHGVGYDLLFAATLLVWIVTRRSLRYPVAPIALLVAGAFATLSFGIQQTGWPYQTVPRSALLIAAMGWLAAELCAPLVTRLEPAKHLRLLAAVLVVVVVLPATLFALKRIVRGRNQGAVTLQQQIYATLPPGTHVYVLSTNFYNFSDVVHDHLLWGGRYVHLWMIPAIVRNEDAENGGPPAAFPLPPARVEQLATMTRTNIAEDLHTFAPAVVFIEHCVPEKPCFGLEGLTWNALPWFLRSPVFAAEWKQHYRLQQTTSDWDVYTRIPSSVLFPD